MKTVKLVFILLFCVILAVPLATFNVEPDQISAIDNRKLTENPFTSGAEHLLDELEHYVEDRIGLRTEMINAYTLANDTLFGEMVHPSYTYGQDGYVFFKMSKNAEWDAYRQTFADFTVRAKNYCESRDIPFVFAFSPSKIAVMQDKLPEGVSFQNEWVTELFRQLGQNGVRYVDNQKTLTELYLEGKAVFNKQYNAGHWNDLGAFYGVNAILEELQKDFPGIRLNSQEDFTVTQELRTSLMVSQFPIVDYDTIFTPKTALQSVLGSFANELTMHPSYRTVGYYQNNRADTEDKTRVLVFQGSYMNGMGYKFFANACAEYIHVHDYQNVIDMDYYINVFQPDCVVFEVAEYVFTDTYFDSIAMENKTFYPSLSILSSVSETPLSATAHTVTVGEAITQITVSLTEEADGYYLVSGDTVLDLIPLNDGTYTACVRNDAFDSQTAVLCIGKQ